MGTVAATMPEAARFGKSRPGFGGRSAALCRDAGPRSAYSDSFARKSGRVLWVY